MSDLLGVRRHGFPGKPHLTEVEWEALRMTPPSEIAVGDHVFAPQIGSGYHEWSDGEVRGVGLMPAVGSLYEIVAVGAQGALTARRVTDGHEVTQSPPEGHRGLLRLPR
jgi:hypothetical protein